MKLNGERLELTLLTMNDLDFAIAIESDPDLWQFEESVRSKEEAREHFLEKLEAQEEQGCYDFIVTSASGPGKTPIGLAQIWSYVDERKSWEIGFAILPEYQGQGYGSEASKLLLQFAFEQLEAHKVVGMCNSHNEQSSKLMERIGMVREGIFREELFWRGRWADQYFYCILEKEYARLK